MGLHRRKRCLPRRNGLFGDSWSLGPNDLLHPRKTTLNHLLGGQNLCTNTARRVPNNHLEGSSVYVSFPSFSLENKLFAIHQTSFWPVEAFEFSELKTPLVHTFVRGVEAQLKGLPGWVFTDGPPPSHTAAAPKHRRCLPVDRSNSQKYYVGLFSTPFCGLSVAILIAWHRPHLALQPSKWEANGRKRDFGTPWKPRGQTPICGFLRVPVVFCGFLHAFSCENRQFFANVCASRMLRFLGKGENDRRESARSSENLQEAANICEDLRKGSCCCMNKGPGEPAQMKSNCRPPLYRPLKHSMRIIWGKNGRKTGKLRSFLANFPVFGCSSPTSPGQAESHFLAIARIGGACAWQSALQP